jgi:bifunctional non-homologous end joining protein LigD
MAKRAAEKHPKSTVELTHPDRVYWPESGITKQRLAEYYSVVWPRMAPFVVDRPLALIRCPDGIDGPKFFQKHAWRGINPHIEEIADPEDREGDKLLRVTDFDGLIALVQSAALEIHPWGTTTGHFERPDMITMDLDPAENVAWKDVVDAAKELKMHFAEAGLSSFVKTSGGKGLHVVAPLKPDASWDEVKLFAEHMAESMSADHPAKFLSTASKEKRVGKIFVDYLRNGRGNTAVAAYSTRARPGAPVSMPLSWAELDTIKGPADFVVDSFSNGLADFPEDPWKGFFEAAKPLPAPAATRG